MTARSLRTLSAQMAAVKRGRGAGGGMQTPAGPREGTGTRGPPVAAVLGLRGWDLKLQVVASITGNRAKF